LYKETEWPDQVAVTRLKHWFVVEEVTEGLTVERNHGNDPSLVGATVAVIWSESNVTMEQLKRLGGPEMDRIIELVERVIRFCPPNNNTEILVEKPAVGTNEGRICEWFCGSKLR
jgi:hypothetical protein